MRDTVHALMMREIKTRFGSNRLGYFWALAEPIAQAGIMALMFSLIGRSSVSGIPVALFLLVGILPFKMFSKLLPQLSAAVEANKGLLSYRQVSAIDPIITRIIIEAATFLIVYCLLMGFMAWLGFAVIPDNFLAVLYASSLLIIISVGLGLMLCSAVTYWKDISKVVGMITMPMMILSGVMFCATMIPPQYWYLFDWNPIFHAVELSRDGYFSAYSTPIGDWQYLELCAFISFSLGLMTFHLNRMRFITT
ncbi:ABC transporter permease [Shewanella sp. VB17]|nr:ABC transporter permease [Shewanella sp. VB17]